MAEIKMVSCGNCGYEWQQGTDGNHQCSEHMVLTIKRQAAEIERLRGALNTIARHFDSSWPEWRQENVFRARVALLEQK